MRIPALIALTALCATAQAAGMEVRVTDGAGAPLGEAVVYALPTSGASSPGGGGVFLIDQVNRKFVPVVSAVQTGTRINFPNKDDIRHHVYSFSPAKTFDIKLYHGTPANPVLFDKAGTVILGCNIHDNMVAYVLVVDTPYFAMTNAEGVARLDGMPAGTYRLEGWHPRIADPAHPPSKTIELAAEALPPLAFRIALGAAPNQPLFEE